MGILGDVLKVGGSLVGGILGSSSSKKAAKAQEALTREGLALQREMFERQIGLQEPFRQGGLAAQNEILNLLGIETAATAPRQTATTYDPTKTYYLEDGTVFQAPPRAAANTLGFNLPDRGVMEAQRLIQQGKLFTAPAAAPAARRADFGSLAKPFGMAQFEQDPGYAFRQSEGMKALERSAAARGGLLSGSTMKGIQRFGQDLASQEYQNAFNRYQVERAARLNPLQSLMGSGQSSANVLTSSASQYGQAGANTLENIGNARASGYIGSANALSGALSDIGNYFSDKDTLNTILKFKLPGNG